MIIYLKRLKSSKFVRVKAFPMYGGIGVSAPSLHRESTDSLITVQYSAIKPCVLLMSCVLPTAAWDCNPCCTRMPRVNNGCILPTAAWDLHVYVYTCNKPEIATVPEIAGLSGPIMNRMNSTTEVMITCVHTSSVSLTLRREEQRLWGSAGSGEASALLDLWMPSVCPLGPGGHARDTHIHHCTYTIHMYM